MSGPESPNSTSEAKMYYVFLGLSLVFTFFLFHRVNKDAPPNKWISEYDELDLPTHLQCVLDTTMDSAYGCVEDELTCLFDCLFDCLLSCLLNSR